jgi:predicted Rossmann fold nucleotide-binding protein DprA/Smf involved in DNA uptake
MDSGRAVLASAVSPLAPFNVGNAMARNKLIYGHAIATVVVSSSDGSGGTWAGATEAIKRGYGRVLVRDGDNVPGGNKRLIGLGGVAVADVEMVMKEVNERAKPEDLAKKGRLF